MPFVCFVLNLHFQFYNFLTTFFKFSRIKDLHERLLDNLGTWLLLKICFSTIKKNTEFNFDI